MTRHIWIIFLLLLFFAVPASAQSPRVLVVLKDGSTVSGQLIKPDPLEFKYVLPGTKDDVDIKADTFKTGQIALAKVQAITFGNSTNLTVPDPKDATKQIPIKFKDFKGPANADTVITSTGPTWVFYGQIPAGDKCPTKFLIQPEVKANEKTPEVIATYKPEDLRAIYVLPAAPPPAKAATGTGTSMTRRQPTPYDELMDQLAALQFESRRLREDYTLVCRRLSELPHLQSLTPADVCGPIQSFDTAMKQIEQQRQALLSAYEMRQTQISALKTALAYVPKPLPGPSPLPEPYEAFYRRPCIKPVPRCEDPIAAVATIAANNPHGSLEERAAWLHAPPFDKRFVQAAHFPMPRFGLEGERLNSEGVIIYEGMRFVATRDGQYEVSFTTSIPKMAVTLRMQLVLAGPGGCGWTLTLPPIVFDPIKSFIGNYPGEAYQVYHAGYSPMVAEHFAELGDMNIIRQRTARFGGWPEGINRYEILNPSPVITQTTASP